MTVLAAMLTLSMTALSVAVVATDGAVVNASSSPPSEVLWVVGFAALNCLLLLVAVYRIARARR